MVVPIVLARQLSRMRAAWRLPADEQRELALLTRDIHAPLVFSQGDVGSSESGPARPYHPDWPKDLYARLGFDPVGRAWAFTRSGPEHPAHVPTG